MVQGVANTSKRRAMRLLLQLVGPTRLGAARGHWRLPSRRPVMANARIPRPGPGKRSSAHS
eukprot:6137569-Lingulodinium_polyedra.AAC.1